MKIVYPFFAVVLLFTSGCISVDRDRPATRTTTTTVDPPLAPSASVTTRTTTY